MAKLNCMAVLKLALRLSRLLANRLGSVACNSQASLEAELMETNAGQELIEGLTVIFSQVSLEAELIETVILSSQKAHNVLLNGFTRNLNK